MKTSLFGRSSAALTLCLSFVACQSQSEDIKNIEANDLGITELEVAHRTDGFDRFLEIHGLDANGDEVATATLRTGMVRYSADPDLMPEVWAAGTELSISVGDETQGYTSPDRQAHEILPPPQTKLASFVELSSVTEAIADEAGIRFVAHRDEREVPFLISTCYGALFPSDKGSPSQCCRDNYSLWHKIASGSNINKLAWRTFYPDVCRSSSGAIGCVGAACFYGPCGGHIETITQSNTTSAAVFYPSSNPTGACGADSNGTASSGYEVTEPYTGSQTLYAGVTATCPWNDCTSNGYPAYTGTDGFWLTLTAACMETNVSGSVTWNGHTVTCNGNSVSQTFWAPDASIKPVTESGPLFRWMGGCTGSGWCEGAWTTDTTVRAQFSGCAPDAC